MAARAAAGWYAVAVVLHMIGHSTRSASELLAALEAHGVRILADIRSWPGSRRHPQFARAALEAALAAAGLRYVWLGRELGGRRRPRPDSPHVALRIPGFRAYADHMDGPEFRAGIEALLALAAEAPVAVMCAERDWRACHRSYLADHLVAIRGVEVVHLLDGATSEPHRVRPEARPEGDRLVYDRGGERQGRLF